MTPSEAFMATQTEVLRQILQTQQQIAQQMNRGVTTPRKIPYYRINKSTLVIKQ
jgi:hypothetical protein